MHGTLVEGDPKNTAWALKGRVEIKELNGRLKLFCEDVTLTERPPVEPRKKPGEEDENDKKDDKRPKSPERPGTADSAARPGTAESRPGTAEKPGTDEKPGTADRPGTAEKPGTADKESKGPSVAEQLLAKKIAAAIEDDPKAQPPNLHLYLSPIRPKPRMQGILASGAKVVSLFVHQSVSLHFNKPMQTPHSFSVRTYFIFAGIHCTSVPVQQPPLSRNFFPLHIAELILSIITPPKLPNSTKRCSFQAIRMGSLRSHRTPWVILL